MKKIIIALVFLFSFFNYSFAYEFNIQNIEFLEDHKTEFGKKIKDNWRLTSSDKDLSAVLKAKVNADGKYDNEIKVIKSSGSLAYDTKVKQAFLAAIDKDDELLRFYSEVTFKNGAVFLTQNGLSQGEEINYRGKFFSSGEFRSAITIKDKDLIKENAYIIFKTNKKGDILDSKIVNAQDKLLSKLEEARDNFTKLPEAKNFSTDNFWVILVYSKFSRTPYIHFAPREEDVQKILTIEDWKSHYYRAFENMWKAGDTEIQCTLPVAMIVSKDGFIKQYKFKKRKLDIAAFIMENIKLPPLNYSEAFNNYADGISFESAANMGRYINTGEVIAYSHLVPWGPYMRELEYRIKSNWKPNKDNRSKRVVVMFTVEKDGSIKDGVEIIVSSGSKSGDDAAVEAVEKTAPFRPLPKEFEGENVPIEFTFDYNVINRPVDNKIRF